MKRLLIFSLSLLLIMSLAACNGRGSGELKAVVYENEQTVNDVYIAIYDGDGQRLDFGYTINGEVHFRGVKAGSYTLKAITPDDRQQKFKVSIQSDKTEILKINF